MTVPTNTLQTYTQTNIREDLSNMVYNVDPFETPILNLAKRAKADNIYHEWDTDQLAAQDLTNAQIQGDDATAIALTPTARLGNYTQILRKVVSIAGTSQAVKAAGGTNKMGYQLMKKSKELKMDIEGAITNNKARVAGTSSAAGYMAGLPCWLTVNTVFQTGGTPSGANPTGTTAAGSESFGNGTTTRTDNSATAAITETQVEQLAQDVYVASAKKIPYLSVSAVNKQAISKFTGVAGTRFNQVEDKTLKNAIDEYETDFGTIRIIPNLKHARSKDVFAINPEYLKVAYLRPFQTVPLAKTGDSDKKMLIVECTLEVCNERALGGIFDTAG
jgi:hypothetical protein